MKDQLELTIIMLPNGHVQTQGPKKKESPNEFDPVCFFMLETAKKLMHKHNEKLKEEKSPEILGAGGQIINNN